MRLEDSARGLRYDHAIREALVAEGRDASVREVRRALKEGQIRVDGRPRDPGDRARGGEVIALGVFLPRQEAAIAADPELLPRAPVLFEDRRMLALQKPSGVPSAPLRALERGTMLGAAIARAPEIAEAGPPLEGGLVHRLDVGTSGVLLFAKTADVRADLRGAFSEGRIQKRYLALAWDPELRLASDLVLDGWIGPGPSKDRVRVVPPATEGALRARTEARVLARSGDLAWVEARAVTGRRHQIRAHLADAGAPIVGDPIYGAELPHTARILSRLALHASRLTLPEGLAIDAPVEGELAAVLAWLRIPAGA